MKGQAFNPYLPSYEYVPDGEPHVFGDRVYIYGSHDKFNGNGFCLLDYVCYSAPVDDLSSWRYEGVIFKRNQDPQGLPGFMNALYAPDVCRGKDGKYYLYYFLANHGFIGVAVSDKPQGPFSYVGRVKYADGKQIGKKGEPLQFDPGVFVDDDGKIYLYTGFGPVGFGRVFLFGKKATEHGPMCFELNDDMVTVKGDFSYIGVKGAEEGKGTSYEGHEFFEASSMRKFNGKYYFIYSTMLSHELAYAVSDSPKGPFEFGGILVSNGDVGINGSKEALNYTGNTHGSIEKIGDNYYVFYHRHTNRHWCSRQACAEKLVFNDGKFSQAEMTSCGLNDGLLKDVGEYEARIACQLYSKKGTYGYLPVKLPKGVHPYFTQHGKDRLDNPDQYIANFCDGATAVFKYFDIENTTEVSVKVSGKGGGKMLVFANGKIASEIAISKGSNVREFKQKFIADKGKTELKFKYEGKGKVDFISFTLV